jgi:hypothetical protein
MTDTPAPIPAPVAPPEANQDAVAEENTTSLLQEENINDETNNNTTQEDATITTEDELVDNGLSGNSNFCGATYTEAIENCTRELHCPVSLELLNESLPFSSAQYITHAQFTI